MRALSATGILRVWERGQAQHAIDRGITILVAALPGRTRAELAALPIGERDAWIARVRELTFGRHLRAVSRCPTCGTQAEFEVDLASLGLSPSPALAENAPPPPPEPPRVIEVEGLRLSFRLPDSTDLAAAARCGGEAEMQRVLIERCLVEARAGEAVLDREALPAAARAALEEAMALADPRADVVFGMRCLDCGGGWRAPFDIAACLWVEILAEARRLLGEVHSLARAYGWSEGEILAMSPRRRQGYLELVGA